MSVIKLVIFVDKLDNVLSLYDKIRVQRSEAGAPFSDAAYITAPAPTVPTLLGTESGPYAGLQGTTLKFRVDDGHAQTVTFTAPNPIDLSTVIAEFLASATGCTMTDVLGKPQINGIRTGTGGTLEVIGGTGASILGFTVGKKSNGQDANIPLLVGVDTYQYDDQSGHVSYWYREQYYNSISGTYSSRSDWAKGNTGSSISNANLIVGKIKLAKLDGMAWAGAEITITNIYETRKVEGYGIFGANISKVTDAFGEADFMLVKGTTVDVIIKGTSIIRRITVPSTGTSFDLLDDSLVQGDAFQIMVPDLPSAPRMS